MNEQSFDPRVTHEANDVPIGPLKTAASVAGDIFTGISIPKPIKDNALKAFNRLCTAAIDVPVAYLEGVVAEKRAETQARIKLINDTNQQIADQLDVRPEYAQAAVKKFGARIVREQLNIDKISENAALQIQHEKSASGGGGEEAVSEINDDWLNAFEKEAGQKSTEEMQLLFGKILAGEICKPSSFSIKTIRLISQIDQGTAKLFRRFCSLSMSLRVAERDLIFDARVISLGGNAGINVLAKYGLSFASLNTLQEYGLIIPDYNSYMSFASSLVINNTVGLPIIYQNKLWALLPVAETPSDEDLKMHGVALSHAGKELLPIVDIEPNEEYTNALREFFKQKKLELVPVANPVPKEESE